MNLLGSRRAETIGISAGCSVDGKEPPEHYESVALPAELHQRRKARGGTPRPDADDSIPQFACPVKAEIAIRGGKARMGVLRRPGGAGRAAGPAQAAPGGAPRSGGGYAAAGGYYVLYFCIFPVTFQAVILPESFPERIPPAGCRLPKFDKV